MKPLHLQKQLVSETMYNAFGYFVVVVKMEEVLVNAEDAGFTSGTTKEACFLV